MIKKVKIGAVWERSKEDGGVFYTGNTSNLVTPIIINPDMTIYLFKNPHESEKSPDYDVFIAEPPKRQDESEEF